MEWFGFVFTGNRKGDYTEPAEEAYKGVLLRFCPGGRLDFKFYSILPKRSAGGVGRGSNLPAGRPEAFCRRGITLLWKFIFFKKAAQGAA